MAPPPDVVDDDDVDLAQFVRDLLRDDDDAGQRVAGYGCGYGGYGCDDGRSGGDASRGGGASEGGGARARAGMMAGVVGDDAASARAERCGRGRGEEDDDVVDDDDERWVRRRSALGGTVDGDVGEWRTQEGGVTTTPRDHVAGTWATPRAGGGFGISDDVVEVGSEGAIRAVVVTTTLLALQSTTTTTNYLSTKPMEPTELTNKRPGEFAAPRGRRKRKSIFPEDARDFGLERLTHMLMLPAHEAAAKLGVSGTTFKHRCRELGVLRWPHRRLRSIEELYSYVADVLEKVILTNFKHMQEPGSTKMLQLDKDVESLHLDLEALKAHARDLESDFIRKGSVEDVDEPREIAKIRGRVYRHRAAVLLYARDIKLPITNRNERAPHANNVRTHS